MKHIDWKHCQPENVTLHEGAAEYGIDFTIHDMLYRLYLGEPMQVYHHRVQTKYCPFCALTYLERSGRCSGLNTHINELHETLKEYPSVRMILLMENAQK